MSKNKFRKWILIIIVNLLITIVGSELVLRQLGYSTFKPFPYQIEQITPSSPLKSDQLLGYSLTQGEYQYNYVKDYAFKAKHIQDGSRFTGLDTLQKEKRINFYGGSLFYGFGLDDSLVFTYLLQQKLPEFRIANHAIYGHSLVSSLLQINQHLDNNEAPDIAVVSYATFNLSRNVYAIRSRKNFAGNRHIITDKKLLYRYVRLDKKDPLKFKFHLDEFDYAPFWLSEHSVVSNMLEQVYNEYEFRSYKPKKIDKMILDQIITLCAENDIELVFAFITRDKHTKAIKKYLRSKKARNTDIFVDYADEKYNLLPYDGHPNALAHELYSKKLIKYIEYEFKD